MNKQVTLPGEGHENRWTSTPAAFPVGGQTIAPASGTKEPAWAVIILKSGLVPKEVRWPEAPKGTGKFLTEEVSPTPISAIV